MGFTGILESKKRSSSDERLAKRHGPRVLFAEAQPLDEVAVLVRVLALQVIEQLAALAHQLEEPAARMEVFDMRLEMLGEAIDALGEQRDLHLGRAGVLAGALVLLNHLLLLYDLQCHLVSLFTRSSCEPRILNVFQPFG